VTRYGRLLHRLEAVPVAAGLALLGWLGPVAASNLAGAVARTLGPLLPVSAVADRNLRVALPEIDAATRRRIIRGVWDNLGRTIGELPHAAALRATARGPGWEVVGGDIALALAQQGGPAVLFAGHLANWEVLRGVAASYGIALAIFYRAAANPHVDARIRALRANGGGPAGKQFAKGPAGARAALAHLSAGGMLGMLVDQKMNDGIAVPFFGRDAMTAPAAAALALRFGCRLVPVQVQRLGPARFRVVLHAPLALPRTGRRAEDIAALMASVNRTLEGWIRERPAEWLWLHRRWPADRRA
jgi:KDO2-lipid IV(A) lauroyltransferase